ncbi:MAG: hypothetical protein R3Y47_04690 [Lachnospiraceae bacterium]
MSIYDFSVEDHNINVSINHTEDSCEIILEPLVASEAFAYLYQEAFMDVGKEEGLSIGVENNSLECILMKVHVLDETWNDVLLTQDCKLLLKENGSSYYLFQESVDGHFEIPASFEGEIYIPFTDVSVIQGFAFTLVPQGEEVQTLTLEAYSFGEEETVSIYQAYEALEPSLDEVVLVPLEGEAMATVRIDGLDSYEVSYQLQDSYEGVSMNDEGEIYVSSETTAKEIFLDIMLDDTLLISENISLVPILDYMPTDMEVEYFCLTPAEDLTIDYDIENFDALYYYAGYIRLFMLCIVMFLVCFYLNTSKKLEE